MGVIAAQDSLSPLEWLSLKLAGKHADNFRKECKPGKAQPVDVIVRLQGTVDISPDTTSTSKTKVGPSAEVVLAHVLRWMGPTAQVARDAILSAYAADETMPIEEGYLDSAKTLIGAMTKTATTTTSKSGATKGIFQVGHIDLAQLTQATANAIQK